MKQTYNRTPQTYRVIESRPGHRGVVVTDQRLTIPEAKRLATSQLVIVLWFDASGNVRRVQ